MRVAVLDVGSNAANLQVIDVCAGGPPVPVYRLKAPTRLADAVAPDGALTEKGVRRLINAVVAAADAARTQGVTHLIPLATATVRDAANAEQIRERVRAASGVELMSLSGEQEAGLTFLAARRWVGWSAGPMLLLDIGGASMEIAYGGAEHPDLAVSLPLGAGRLTRQFLPSHPAAGRDVHAVRRHVRRTLRPLIEAFDWEVRPHRIVGTSKTFKQLARLTGAPAWRYDPLLRRRLRRKDLRRWIPRLAAMTPAGRAALPGVSPARARQLLAGAVVAETVMEVLRIDHVDVCPWALREGILLRWLDLAVTADGQGDPVIDQAARAALARPGADCPAADAAPLPAAMPQHPLTRPALARIIAGDPGARPVDGPQSRT